MAEISPLRRRMIDDMTIRNLSPATQQSYVYAVAKFSRFFGRSPDRLGAGGGARLSAPPDRAAACRGRISTRRCAPCASSTASRLGRTDALERIVAAREPQKLPVVLSADEIVRFLEAVPGLRNRVALTTAYGGGLAGVARSRA